MSFYVQITNRCNMSCAHCCFSCTARGSDMSEKDFKASIALAVEFNQPITIGGGEPTLHGWFMRYLNHAIKELKQIGEDMGCPAVHLVTNGSNTRLSLKLADMAKEGIVAVALSQDKYHDPIDPQVVKAFTKPPQGHCYETGNPTPEDSRAINDGKGYIQPVGRAKDWGYHPLRTCVCDSVFINPKGIVYPCACKVPSSKLGHVFQVLQNGGLVYEHFDGYCAKSTGYKENVVPVMRGEIPA